MPPALAADLSHNALLAVTGDDATGFLQAQLTNDVQALAPGSAQWNGWCSAKGRLLATFLLARRHDGYLAMLPAEIAPAIAKRLAMFVLRSKVKIEDVSARFARIGVVGAAAGDAVARHFGAVPPPMRVVERDGAIAVALEAERCAVFAPVEGRAVLLESMALQTTAEGAEAWAHAAVRAGIPIIVAATQDAFVPQMANFELVGGVSFRKGCYPGQEIVARTQYRGILKKRMAIAHVAGAAPEPGQSVYSPEFADQAAGMVVQASPAPAGGFDFLVVAQLESLRGGALRLGSPDGAPIEVRSYPATDRAS